MDLVKRFVKIVANVKAPAREPRRVRRTTCRLPVEVRMEKSSVPAVLTEISVLGARIEAQGRLSKGMVAIAMPSTTKGLLRGRIVWVKGQTAGLVFEDTEEAKSQSWLKDLLVTAGFTQDNIKERRRYVRAQTSLPTYITSRADDPLSEGILLNLGRGGGMMQCETAIELGTRCKLRLDPLHGLATMDVEAVVVAVRQDRGVLRQHFISLAFELDDDPGVIKLVSANFR